MDLTNASKAVSSLYRLALSKLRWNEWNDPRPGYPDMRCSWHPRLLIVQRIWGLRSTVSTPNRTVPNSCLFQLPIAPIWEVTRSVSTNLKSNIWASGIAFGNWHLHSCFSCSGLTRPKVWTKAYVSQAAQGVISARLGVLEDDSRVSCKVGHDCTPFANPNS